ncbi:MAG: PilN domain-containing protein [Deltaproteobacteria bacterium]|nr:PilN domain-containing protein [Deltaproteobacteria bacterium]
MIRINLLPYREKEKIEDITRQIMVIGITFVVFVLSLGSFHLYLSMSISSLEENITKQQNELDRLNKIILDIDTFKRDKALLEKKIAIINTLEENRLAPVRMLDELTSMVPVKDVWLERLSEKGTAITIEGMARNNIAVAHFMKNLAGSTFIKSVDLVSTKEKEISGIKLQQFIISCVKKKG